MYCALKPGNAPLFSNAATWLIMSKRRPSSDGEAALFGAVVHAAFGAGFAKDNGAYRAGLNFFSPSIDAGNVTPTQAAPLSTM